HVIEEYNRRLLFLNTVKTQETYELLPVSSERTFPAAPFPRKYVHCAIDDLRDAVLSVLALRTAGYSPGDIHIMASWDFVEAVERRHQQHTPLSRMLMRCWSFLDEGLGDGSLHEAHRGRHILVVRLCSYEQSEQVRDLLSPYHAHLMKYVDTWTVTDLSA
ncbi:MAG TPA: hypothetical protein VF844_11440, partial [Ktedonobacteraceae bacterium]